MKFQDNDALTFLATKEVALNPQNSVLRSADYYFSVNVDSAAGHYPLLRQSDSFQEGVRTFDKAAIPSGEHVAVKGWQVRVAADVATGLGDSVYKSVATNCPGDFLNSMLQIKIGSEVICNEKIEDLLAEAATEGLGGAIYFPIENWKHIPGGRTIEATLIVPQGEVIEVTNNLNLKVKPVGTAAKLK